MTSFGEGLDFEQEILAKLYVEDQVATQMPTKDSVVRDDALQLAMGNENIDTSILIGFE